MQTLKSPHFEPARLWFGMVGSLVVWAGHFVLLWAVVEFGCRLGISESAIYLAVVGISAIALVAMALVASVGYRNWRRVNRVEQREAAADFRGYGRAQFMTIFGLVITVALTVVVIYSTIPVFVLPTCDIIPTVA